MSVAAANADEARYSFNIPAQDAASALDQIAEVTGSIGLFPYDLAAAQRANAVVGRYTLSEALEVLLKGTILSAELSDKRVISIVRNAETERQSEKGDETMHSSKTSLVQRIGAAIVGLFAAATVGAQGVGTSAREAGSSLIEEVVVTARWREETAQSVPIPITAMSGQDLVDRVANDIRDISRITPNMDYGNAFQNKGAAQVFLRGIGQINWLPTQDPKVGVYLDGVYLGRPQGAVFDLMDIDRVEVLRGPQGTLFGRNTTAGLVHVVTKKPGDEFVAEIKVGGGNDGQWIGGGILNIPVSDSLATRFSVQHRESDGYTRNVETGKDWNDENSDLFRGSALWAPSDTFDLQLIFDYQRVRERPGLASCEWTGPADGADVFKEFVTNRNFGTQTAAYILNVYDDIRNACNNTSPRDSGENDPDDSTLDAWGLNLTLNWSMGFATLTSITSYREMDDLSDSTGAALDKVGTPSYLEILAVGENPSDQFSQEIRLSNSTDSLDWVGGVYYFQEQSVNRINVPLFRDVALPDCAVWPLFCAQVVPGAPQFGTLGDIVTGALQGSGSRIQAIDAENSSFAVFGEVTWRFLENWSITAGIRYTEDEREFHRSQVLSAGALVPGFKCPDGTPPTDNTLAGVVGPMTCFAEEDFDKITPRLIVSWNVSEDVMLYGGWSNGYSSGGFNTDANMRPFEPEESDNWEFGMKSLLADGRMQLNLTGFFNDYKNQQIVVPRQIDSQPTAELFNVQQAELWGIEGELQWVPADGWLIAASVGWIDGDYKEFTVVDTFTGPPPGNLPIRTERDLSDKEIIRGSPYTFSVTTAYTHYLARGGDITTQAGWSQRGRIYNTLEAHRSSRQDAFGLMDARITWMLPNGRTSVSLWGRNLLDEEYFPAASDFSGGLTPDDAQFVPGEGQPLGMINRYWAEPRRFGLELQHRFE